MRIVRARLSWKDWLFLDYARYLYGIGALMLDLFAPLWLKDEFHVADTLGAVLVFGVLILLIAAEFYGYTILWPEKFLDRDEIEL